MFNNIATIQTRIAALLKAADWPTLVATAPQWLSLVADGQQGAYADIVSSFAHRGYSQSQIDGWDYGPIVELDQATWYALTKGGALQNYDQKFIDRLDWRERLRVLPMLQAGLPATPTGHPSITRGSMDDSLSTFFRRPSKGGPGVGGWIQRPDQTAW